MARRRNYRRYARRARSIGGSQKDIIDGVLAGVGAGLGSKYLGSWGTAAGYLGVGYFRRNNTLKTLGGIALGRQLSSMIPFLGGNGSSNSGLFEA